LVFSQPPSHAPYFQIGTQYFWDMNTHELKVNYSRRGDQLGFVSSPPEPVNLRWFSPFACITWRCYFPARFEEKAMNLPSGDHVGSSLSADSAVSFLGSPPSTPIVKIAKRFPTLPV